MQNITRRNLLKKSMLGGLGLILNSCRNRKDKPLKEPEEVSINLSEFRNFYKGTYYKGILYAGMPNKESFSISNPHYGSNLYYPINSKEISMRGWEYEVISVDPNQITLKLK